MACKDIRIMHSQRQTIFLTPHAKELPSLPNPVKVLANLERDLGRLFLKVDRILANDNRH